MELTIRLFAVLRERLGRDELLLKDLPDELSMAELKQRALECHPELGDLTSIAGVIGDRYARDATTVRAGDAVAFLPPVSGGSSGASATGEDLVAGIFELSEEPLDIAALQARVQHPSCGALLSFTGMTRDQNRGQSVLRLDYEAFAAMAGPEMGRIFAECRHEHGDGGDPERHPERQLRMLCVHRVGTVAVGEPSIVIAVASPHRAAAFEAARFLIDTLKERLPVWKKEVYTGGQHWIGDRS